MICVRMSLIQSQQRRIGRQNVGEFNQDGVRLVEQLDDQCEKRKLI